MADPDQKNKFEREYAQFLFSELVIDGMKEEHLSVRTLSKLSGVSTSIIQNIRKKGTDSIVFGIIFAIP